MPRSRQEQQFDEYRDWQWCKHLVFSRYVKPWSVISGKFAREIFVVDACAGAGAYTDPETGETITEGSPIIFARRAAAYTAERGPGKSMRVICAERNMNNFRLLEQRLQPYAPHAIARNGSFRRHVPWIVETIGDAPALVVLDPMGLKTISPDAWQPLLERTGKTDLFIVLIFSGLHRIGGMLLPDGTPNPTVPQARRAAMGMDAVFRGPEWRSIAIDPELAGERNSEERERLYVGLFCRQVVGNHLRYKAPFDVRASLHAPLKYWLVHASDDLKPYMLMNDEIVGLKEIMFAREHSQPGQLDGFQEAELDAYRAAIRTELERATISVLEGAFGHALPFGAIRDKLIPSFFGRVKQGAYWNVVKELAKKGYPLKREKRPGAGVDEAEIITLIEPNTSGPTDDAAVVPIRRVA